MVPRKGHRAAVQAFAKVATEFPEAHYLIGGTGPEESRIRQQVQDLGLENRITFAGFIPGEQLPELYNLCDVALLANRQEADGDIEGFGIVFLEANAAGKPVIGGRSGGAIEAIEHGVTGYLINPDDPDEIAAALRKLLSDRSLRERLGAAGRERVISEFQWQTRARILDGINEDLASGRTIRRQTGKYLVNEDHLRRDRAVSVGQQQK
jgi:phosphatidylinositol alpha-1,6-mannosyltransferase